MLRQHGADPQQVLAAVGLPPGALDSPDHTIPYQAFGSLMALAAHQTRRPDLGLQTGRRWTLAHMGLLGELMRHSATLGDALRTLAVYHRLNSEGGVVFLSLDEDMAVLGYAIHHPGVDGVPHIHDGVMACGCALIRELVGPGWKPRKVVVARGAPEDPGPWRECFRARVEFDGDHTALYLHRSTLAQRIRGARADRLRELEARVEAATASDLVVRVRRAVRLLLLHGGATGDDIAQQLALHRRTLHRQLQARGTTFQQILDEVRQDIARQLLGSTRLTLAQIASATGYADTSTFVRAFRRWSGTTPAAWREARGVSDASSGAASSREW
jgi:AraC-like DNA-binding protein